jgi:endonuclease/exonuclease/phosphatase (EEP) superfamily protein YafD
VVKKRQVNWARVLSFVTVGYVLGLLIWLGLWLVVGDRFWLLMLVHRAVPLLFLPLPLLVLGNIALRSPRRLWPVLGVPLLVFAGFYHPYLVPRWPPRERVFDVSVITYNMLNSNQEYDAIARLILTYRPDFVALQEVRELALAGLTERLGAAYPYSLLGVGKTGTTAILSRHPVHAGQVLDLGSKPDAVLVKAQVEGTEIMFVSVHLLAYLLQWVEWYEVPRTIERRTALQNQQVQVLLAALPADSEVVLLGCDCNANETSMSYRMLSRQLANAARAPGGGRAPDGTVPDRRLQRLDYVFYRGAVVPVGTYRILDWAGSDHQAVLARFRFVRSVD